MYFMSPVPEVDRLPQPANIRGVRHAVQIWRDGNVVVVKLRNGWWSNSVRRRNVCLPLKAQSHFEMSTLRGLSELGVIPKKAFDAHFALWKKHKEGKDRVEHVKYLRESAQEAGFKIVPIRKKKGQRIAATTSP